MRPAWLRSPEADTLLLLLRGHVLPWNLGLHRHACRSLGPLKLGIALALPLRHLLGLVEPLADLAQPRTAARAPGPLKLGIAWALPLRHLLGLDDPLADLPQPLVVAPAALVK